MASQKISRNDPCPCGSGKKFKHCCYGKGIDWEARRQPQLLRPVPRSKSAPPAPIAIPGIFGIVDARLKELAKEAAEPADWKDLVARLSEATPDEERIRAYQAIRAAHVLPEERVDFLFGHATQYMFPKEGRIIPEDAEDAEFDEAFDRHVLALLRSFGRDDLADLYVSDRLEYDRRYERGRQYFFGPPDSGLAASLREKGIIG